MCECEADTEEAVTVELADEVTELMGWDRLSLSACVRPPATHVSLRSRKNAVRLLAAGVLLVQVSCNTCRSFDTSTR